ncbi:MAG: hypothetical protein AMXMBFR48_19150 [Ignavibacteriales bacterium]
MIRFLAAFVFLFLSFMLQSQTFKQVKVYVPNPQTQLREMEELGADVEHAIVEKDGSYVIFMDQTAYKELNRRGYRMDVLIEDWAEHFEKLPQLSDQETAALKQESKEKYGVEGFGLGSLAGFYTFNEAMAQLDSMKVMYPNLITSKIQIGSTVENRPIYMVKISDNPDMEEIEPEALYTAMHHAREPGGMMTVIYFMYYLLENYATNPSVKYLVDNRQLYFIPVVNPDGYEHNRTTNPSGGGMWRKNRKNNGSSYGIDLNRNYGPQAYWNAPNGGSSTSPSSDTYRGTAPFSEPETQALRDLVNSRKFRVALNYHTYSNLLIYPYGALSHETPDSMIFREYATEMTQFNGYSPGTDMQTVGYSTRGNSDDFMYDGDLTTRGKILAMTPEVGTTSDGFWPPQSRIYPHVQENLFPNLYYAWAAGDYVSKKNVSYDRQYFGQGETAQMFVQLKNKGLSVATNLALSLVSASPQITAGTAVVQIDSISARSDYQITSPLSFTISADAAIGSEHKLIIKTNSQGVLMSSDTVRIIIGMPVYTFFDTTNNPASLWTITASPATPKWEATSSSYNSSPNSYTDSKDGNYVANATVTMTMTNPVNLAGVPNPRLTFWSRWFIEADWDAGFVKISTNNGSTWTPLAGRFTKPAAGQGKQVPAGAPVYEGTQSGWVQEEIDLGSYSGQSIKLRFELGSDGSIHQDGWFLDDIGIYTWGVVPVELTSFTASVSVNGAELRWITATETNNRGFEIQRSLNGAEWITAGYKPGTGTSAEQTEYTWTDNNAPEGTVFYRLLQYDYDGSMRIYGPVTAEISTVTEFSLGQNYPNPFNPVTTIRYSLAERGSVSLTVFDAQGSEVAVLVSGARDAGRHEVQFDASSLPSGVYIYRLEAGTYRESRKLILLK